MNRLIHLLEKLVFFVAGLVIVFIAHFSKGHAAPPDMADLQVASILPIQVSMQEAGGLR